MHHTTVMDHLHRCGVHGRSSRKRSDKQTADATCRYQQGATLDQLADWFRVAPSTIRQALDAEGVPIRLRGRQPAS